MLTVLFAAKGGSGTTVLAAAWGIAAVTPTLLVDLAGDVPGVLGLAEPDGPGVLDWLGSDATTSRLPRLELDAGDGLAVLPRGTARSVAPARWAQLAEALLADGRDVVVDAGSGVPPGELVAVADRTLLVTRSCYLSLRNAARMPFRPTGVVLVHEPGRSLGTREIEAAVGAPVVCTVLLDPGIARAVDAGLLARRLPHGFRRALRVAA